MEYLYILREALVWMVTIFWIYQMAISVCALIKFKDKPLKIKKDHRFMAIIPAHNEEAVVGNLIESLKNQTYNKELYDIYVIADNCTDNTAKVAKEAGAIVYERFDSTKKTKGYALNWFLQQKIEEDAPYDAFFIFDADNIVDKNFIKNMNKKLCQGEDVVQGYRDIKNPTDSWITAGYAIFYWTLHRFYHLARYNIGLSPLLNGTGFMVRFDVVKPNGWDTQTLTEDIEFSLKRIIAGKRLGWATDAIVYDEQPVGFKQSWSQRSRWTVGHIQCMHKYTKDLAMAAKENKTFIIGMICGAILIMSVMNLKENIEENYDISNNEPFAYLEENLQPEDIIVYTSINNGGVVAALIDSNQQYFLNVDNWTIEEAYKAYAPQMKVAYSFEEAMKEAKGRIFIIDDGSLSCYNRLENKEEYKQVEIKKFEPKYKEYTYQIVVLEKIK